MPTLTRKKVRMSRNSFLQDAVGVRVATPERAAEGAIGQYPTGGLKAGVSVDLERREEGTMRTRFVLLCIGVLVAFGAGALVLVIDTHVSVAGLYRAPSP